MASILSVLGVRLQSPARDAYELDELVGEVVGPSPDLASMSVRKRRAHFTFGGCLAEVTDVEAGSRSTRTLAVEAADPGLVRAAVEELGLWSRPNVSFPRGLKTLVGFGARRWRSSTSARTRSSSTSPSGRRTAPGVSWSTGPR